MQSETIRSHWPAHYLGVMSCLAALVMASEAGAGALFPGQKFRAGDGPSSVAVADLDGDVVPCGICTCLQSTSLKSGSKLGWSTRRNSKKLEPP